MYTVYGHLILIPHRIKSLNGSMYFFPPLHSFFFSSFSALAFHLHSLHSSAILLMSGVSSSFFLFLSLLPALLSSCKGSLESRETAKCSLSKQKGQSEITHANWSILRDWLRLKKVKILTSHCNWALSLRVRKKRQR